MSSIKVQISVSDSRRVGTLQRKKSEIIFLSFGSRFTPVLWGPTRRGPANRIRPQLLVKENQALTYITVPDQEETSASRCIPLCGIKVLSTRFICPIAATSFHWRLRADWRDNGQTAACVRSWPFDRPNATLFALWCHRRAAEAGWNTVQTERKTHVDTCETNLRSLVSSRGRATWNMIWQRNKDFSMQLPPKNVWFFYTHNICSMPFWDKIQCVNIYILS